MPTSGASKLFEKKKPTKNSLYDGRPFLYQNLRSLMIGGGPYSIDLDWRQVASDENRAKDE